MTLGVAGMFLLTHVAIIAAYACAGWIIFYLPNTAHNEQEDDLFFLPAEVKEKFANTMQGSVVSRLLVYVFAVFITVFYTTLAVGLMMLILKTSLLRSVMCFVGWIMLFALSGHINGSVAPLVVTIRIFIVTAISVVWIFFPSWFVLDAVALLWVVALLVEYGSYITPRLAVLISACVMVFDVIAVFVSGFMQKLVMHSMGSIPNMLIIPDSPIHPKSGFGIGLGDVIFVGIIVMLAFRKSVQYKKPSLVVATLLGYFFGSCCAIAAVIVFGAMQPATIYLLPATLGAFALTAWRCGVLADMCRFRSHK